MSTQSTRTFTNDAWREMAEQERAVITTQRVKGEGPVRTGHRYEVRLHGEVKGFVEVVGRGAWAIYRADGTPTGNDMRFPFYGPLSSVVWTLAR